MRTPQRFTAHLLAVLLVAIVVADDVAAQEQALVGARVLASDGRSWIDDAVVRIDGDRIVAVGPRALTPVPEDAKRIDVDGKWIVPGLIDAHVHFFQSGGLYTRPDVVDLTSLRSYEDELATIRANLADTFRRWTACGVTTVLDVGGPMWNFEVRELARADSFAPRVLAAGPLVSTYQPEALTTDDPPILKVEDADGAREVVRRQLEKKADLIKIWFIVRRGEKPEDSRALVRATIDEAHGAGVRVAVHATQLETARVAVEEGADVLVHSVEEPIDEAFVKLIVARKVVYVPTLMVSGRYGDALGGVTKPMKLLDIEHRLANPTIVSTFRDLRGIAPNDLPPAARRLRRMSRRWYGRNTSLMQKNLAEIHAAGGIVAAGTDAGNIGTLHGPSLFRELELMAAAGLPPADVLRAATVGGAQAAGRDDFGVIAAGKSADLVVLNADPLVDVRHLQRIDRVVRAGRVFTPDDILPPSPVDIVQRQVNAYNDRDVDRFAKTFAEDVEVFSLPSGKLSVQGRAALRERYAGFFENTPDLHCHVVNRIAEGRFVTDHEHVRGMRGRDVVKAIAIYEVVGRTIRRVWFPEIR